MYDPEGKAAKKPMSLKEFLSEENMKKIAQEVYRMYVSLKNASNTGAAKPFTKGKTGSSSEAANCYAYALGLEIAKRVGDSGRPPESNDIKDYIEAVMSDFTHPHGGLGRGIRKIEHFDTHIEDNEYRIAMRIGTTLYNNRVNPPFYDFHFMVQTDTGQWAEKHGPGYEAVLHPIYESPDTLRWTIDDVDYYDSEIVYFAITW